MKKAALMMVSVLMLLFTFSASAEVYYYPDGNNPLFSITFPNHWSVEPEEELLHASPPDETIYLGLWAVEDAETVEDAINALESSMGDLIQNVEFGDPEEFENNGIAFLGIDGAGTDEDGNPMNISFGIFTPDGETFCILFYLGTPENEAKYEDSLTGIILSIQAE